MNESSARSRVFSLSSCTIETGKQGQVQYEVGQTIPDINGDEGELEDKDAEVMQDWKGNADHLRNMGPITEEESEQSRECKKQSLPARIIYSTESQVPSTKLLFSR